MLPSKQQWLSWSLPSKLTLIGTYTGIAALILSIIFFVYPMVMANSQEKSDSAQKGKILINGILDSDKFLDEAALVFPNDTGVEPGLYIKLSSSVEQKMVQEGYGISWAGMSWNERISMRIESISSKLILSSEMIRDSLTRRKIVEISVKKGLPYISHYSLILEDDLVCDINFDKGKGSKAGVDFDVVPDTPMFVWDDSAIPTDCK